MSITSKTELITPERAKELKASSRGNRTISSNRVRTYANDMKNGDWQNNGEPIILGANGHLRDGHHRIEAIIESGVSVWVTVVSGVDPEVTVFDVGRFRTSSDIARFRGADTGLFSSSNYAVANMHFALEKGSSYVASYLEKTKFIERHAENLSQIQTKYSSTDNGTSAKFLRTAPYRYVMLCALENGVPLDTLTRFTHVVKTQMSFDEEESCAVILARMINNSPLVTSRSSAGRANAVALVDTALRLFVARTRRQVNFDWRYVKRSYFIREENSESRD